MADVEQWVNLTIRSKWKGKGNHTEITDLMQMGSMVSVKFSMAQKKRASIFVTKKADGGNAPYTDTEKKRRSLFRPREFTKRKFRTDKDGVKIVRTPVTAAGGDKFTFEAEDKAGGKVTGDTFLTRRRLYYQFIEMDGANSPGSAFFESEFWTTGEHLYIDMVEVSPGSKITARDNVNRDVVATISAVKSEARTKYDKSKKPYSFVTLFIKKLCTPATETAAMPVTFNAPTHTLTISGKALFDFIDPADEYYGASEYIKWQDTAGGPEIPLAKARCTRSGRKNVIIDTTGLPPGVPGTLSYSLRILGKALAGTSYVADNFTMVATVSWDGTQRPPGDVKKTTNHEVGHKIGMVPGPRGTPALDQQNTYYDGKGHNGGHCEQGINPPQAIYSPFPAGIQPTCMMFGSSAMANSIHFCADCRKSLRKLDLRARTNVGLRTQF